jgi:hypothetical protein
VSFKETFQRAGGARGVDLYEGFQQRRQAAQDRNPGRRIRRHAHRDHRLFSGKLANGVQRSGQFTRRVWYSPKLGHPVRIDITDTDRVGKLLVRERVELMHAQRRTPALMQQGRSWRALAAAAALAATLLASGCATRAPAVDRDGPEANPPADLAPGARRASRVWSRCAWAGPTSPTAVLGQSYAPLTGDLPLVRARPGQLVRPQVPRPAHGQRRDLQHVRHDSGAQDHADTQLCARAQPGQRARGGGARQRPRAVQPKAGSST